MITMTSRETPATLFALLTMAACASNSAYGVDAGTDVASDRARPDASVLETGVNDIGANPSSDASHHANHDATIPTDAALQDTMNAVDAAVNDSSVPHGSWQLRDEREFLTRPYLNCISGDGNTVGYTLDRGVFEIRLRSANVWQSPINYNANAILGSTQVSFRRCSFSEDGGRLLIATPSVAVLAERHNGVYETIASLTPFGNRVFSDERALLSANGRRAVIGDFVFDDVNGGWRNWQRTPLPASGFLGSSNRVQVGGQYTGTPNLDVLLATGMSTDANASLRTLKYQLVGNEWTMRVVNDACISRRCALNHDATQAVSCVSSGTAMHDGNRVGPTTLRCEVRSLAGAVVRTITANANMLYSRCIAVDVEAEVEWAGSEALVGISCDQPRERNPDGISWNIPTTGFMVYNWGDTGFVPFPARGVSAGDVSADYTGSNVLITNSGGTTAWIFDR